MFAKILDYTTIRSLQISFVFAFTLFLQFLLNYPNAYWTGFAVMMIYAGFDNGTSLLRTYHRFLGVIFGLISGYLLVIIGRYDLMFLFLEITLVIFLAYFFAGETYSVPTIFTVNTSVIGTGYFSNAQTVTLLYYLVDYCICTCVAFGLIWFLETYWFNRYNLIERFILDVEKKVLKNLRNLKALLHEGPVNRTKWYKACGFTIHSLTRIKELLNNTSFCKHSDMIARDDILLFIQSAETSYTRLKALYFAQIF